MSKRNIEDEVQHVLTKLSTLDPDSEEYGKAARNLQALYEARSKRPSKIIEADTIVLALTNILGIVLILNYEQIHVVSSKAISFIAKGRLL